MPDARLTRRRTATLMLGLALMVGHSIPRALAADPGVDIADAVAGPVRVFMADPRAVGISVGVIHAGRRHGFHAGTVSKQRLSIANDNTLYPIASLTKTFTGLLLAQAQLDGKLRLDDDLRIHLAGDYPNLAFAAKPIRVDQLLNHRSGLPRMFPDVPETDPGFASPVPYSERIASLFAHRTRADFYADLHKVKLTTAPGARFQYSNVAAQLAGDILERVYGSDFGSLVSKHITAPLGMADTVITPSAEQRGRLAHGYDENGTLQPIATEPYAPAGGLRSTLTDMLAYAAWQLAEQDAAVRLSHRATFEDGAYTVGLNWQILTRDSRRVIFQDGSVPGFSSLLVLHPESGIAVVLLSNEIDRSTAGRMAALADSIAMALDANAMALP